MLSPHLVISNSPNRSGVGEYIYECVSCRSRADHGCENQQNNENNTNYNNTSTTTTTTNNNHNNPDQIADPVLGHPFAGIVDNSTSFGFSFAAQLGSKLFRGMFFKAPVAMKISKLSSVHSAAVTMSQEKFKNKLINFNSIVNQQPQISHPTKVLYNPPPPLLQQHQISQPDYNNPYNYSNNIPNNPSNNNSPPSLIPQSYYNPNQPVLALPVKRKYNKSADYSERRKATIADKRRRERERQQQLLAQADAAHHNNSNDLHDPSSLGENSSLEDQEDDQQSNNEHNYVSGGEDMQLPPVESTDDLHE